MSILSRPEQRVALQDYWRFHDLHRDDLATRVARFIEAYRAEHPLALPITQLAFLDPADETVVRAGIVDGEWAPYLERLAQRGERYAEQGVPCAHWFTELRAFRDIVRGLLVEIVLADGARVPEIVRIYTGMTALFDLTFDTIGDAYLQTLQRLNLRAEEALHASQQRLRHAQKMEALGRLAGGVAHDFNNLLTVIESYACLLEDSLLPADERRQDASEVRRAAERAANVTRQLLAMSRQGRASPHAIDLNEVVAGFIPMLRRLVGHSIAITTHRGRIPPVVADPGELEQVLMNLAVNARDAMEDGGKLVIATAAMVFDEAAAQVRGVGAGAHVELSVTDTGTGMDPATAARIFEPFFTTKDPGKGTGLGLSIVREIIERAGGAVRVYSEPGQGTTFRLYLPAGTDDVVAPIAAGAEEPRELPAWNVLLVDDQADVRAVAVRILRDAGCQVLEAGTGEEARRLCVSHDGPLDLALIDLILPDARGELLIDELRDIRPALRFLTTSGFPVQALSERGPTPVDLLGKPFTPGELRGAVARAMGGDRAGAGAAAGA
ncbi:MAG TPA: ATP-binding protein, partial [Kofleriaceae bacterium]|nr:ATP-binding protein [Kofleriaceae bacterium]